MTRLLLTLTLLGVQFSYAYEYKLQFTPQAGARGLVVAGYQFDGGTVVGNCSYDTVSAGSGRGSHGKTTHHYNNRASQKRTVGECLRTGSADNVLNSHDRRIGIRNALAELHERCIAGSAVRLPGVAKESWFYCDCTTHSCIWHRCEYGALQHCPSGTASSTSLPRAGAHRRFVGAQPAARL
jgi:hypothetical protein